MEAAPVAAPAAGAPEGGDRRGGRGGFGRGAPRGGPRERRGDKEEKEGWTPVTKLGRLVQAGLINSLDEIFYHGLPIKEYEIVDHFLGSTLKDEVMKIMPVQRMTAAGQRTRFKAFVAVGDNNGHIGLGVKCSAEVATAIRGALNQAKVSVVPVRRGYWGKNVGNVHTVPYKVHGKCGSVRVRLIPAPRGTGLVASPVLSRFLTMAGISDVYTSSTGKTRTTGNTVKACYHALRETYGYLSPDLWTVTTPAKSPIQEHSAFLEKGKVARESTARKTGAPRGGDRERRPPRERRE